MSFWVLSGVALQLVLLPENLSAQHSEAIPEAPATSMMDRFELDQWGRFWELMAHERLLAVIAAPKNTLSPFTSDGCSGGFSSSWEQIAGYWPGFADRYQQEPPFESCCITHDRAYHDTTGAADAAYSYGARLRADRELRHCVWQTAQDQRAELARLYSVSEEVLELGFGQLGWAMFYAVRFGGQPCSGLSWRWGYGYPDC
ncbi:hypothetical protein [Phaeobacter sp. CECT 5382]|uniref:hypothetical protein n=1 Tax=Phaeobacter sp. CECT 5382 TaxID=1712645 RepID=UPI001E3EA57C|nr:hypothetical protein [Phaeobacter sp. CECT 5382]